MPKARQAIKLTKEDLQEIKKRDLGDTDWLHKDKRFLLHLPLDLHKAAKKVAFENDLSLHDYILQCINIVSDTVKKK